MINYNSKLNEEKGRDVLTLEPRNKHSINDENYYSQEMGKRYLSVHALMTYLADPSLFWLKQNGVLKNTSSPSANAGKIFHAFMHCKEDFDKEMLTLGKEPFSVGRKKLEPEEIMEMIYEDPSQLQPKADYVDIWNYIVRNWYRRDEIWEDDEYVKEMILVGEIGEAPFKGRLDGLKIDGDKAYIYDYKTIALKERYGFWKDAEGEFHEKTFIEEYNYDLQMTAYAELVRQNFPQVKQVYITFGMLIKRGKTRFTEYPSAFVEAETVKVEDLYKPRFKEGRTPFAVLNEFSLEAYVTMNQTYAEYKARRSPSLMMAMVYGEGGEHLTFNDFRLR